MRASSGVMSCSARPHTDSLEPFHHGEKEDFGAVLVILS